MTTWTNDELTRIGTADELQISSARGDGTLGNPRTIWCRPAVSVATPGLPERLPTRAFATVRLRRLGRFEHPIAIGCGSPSGMIGWVR
jgi:hypothetical protein